MCTCITYHNQNFYFGRNLDLAMSFQEKVVITPRNYPFTFHNGEVLQHHYAIIGMAAELDSYPLYAEAANEKGLCMAGLYFPGYAVYQKPQKDQQQIAPFELIPWLLAGCASVAEAELRLRQIELAEIPFRGDIPIAPLHWLLADAKRCLVIEAVAEGLQLYENPYGVLTNNPPFPYHQIHLNNYLNITAEQPENRFAESLSLQPYGQGMGAIGLPGDALPASRFVKAAFLKWNSVCPQEEMVNITQFFHILDQVSMVRGAVCISKDQYDITTYTCCINAKQGIYYYKTYENNQIQGIRLFQEDLEQPNLICYELAKQQQVHYVNEMV